MILEMAKQESIEKCKLLHSLNKFISIVKSPEIFLEPQIVKAEKGKTLTKILYDYAKCQELRPAKEIPNELFVNEMDEEQIWQQLELQNNRFLRKCLQDTSKLLAYNENKFCLKYKLAGEEEDTDDNKNENDLNQVETDNDFSDETEHDDEDELKNDDSQDHENEHEKIQENKIKKLFKPSIVDDKFFKLREMEQFLEQEDKKEVRKANRSKTEGSDEDEIDYFNDLSDKDDEDEKINNKHLKYSGFFDDENISKDKKSKRKSKKVGGDLEGGEKQEGLDDVEDSEEFEKSENEDDVGEDSIKKKPDGTQSKSSFEQRQQRLENRISELEEAALAEKSWQLKGEVDSSSRPQNSLLQEILNFDATTRPAPVITEATTMQLEDIIKQRIKDKAWDDIERKFKPVNTPQEFRKKLVLDQEKSKESLAQIYEKEYLKEVEKLTPNTVVERDEEVPETHREIRKIMKSLFDKLDALSNFYYTPRPAMPEVRIITNTPAINMEEVAPISTGDAQLLAPEEIKLRPKGNVMGQTERSKSDKNRERRHKKLKQKHAKLDAEKREKERQLKGIQSTTKQEQTKLLAKVSKSRNVKKMIETSDGKSLKSSKSFFSQLQDEVTTNKLDKKKKVKRSANDKNELKAKRFKL